MEKPNGFCIVVDTREQLPYSWPGIPTVRKALPIGDYSVSGLEDRIGVERKAHADFVRTVTRDHEPFFRKIAAGISRVVVTREKATDRPGVAIVRGCVFYAIVIEATAAALDSPMPWTQVTPSQVHGNLIKLACLGVPVWPAGTRARAAAWTLAYLRRAWEEVHGLHR